MQFNISVVADVGLPTHGEGPAHWVERDRAAFVELRTRRVGLHTQRASIRI